MPLPMASVAPADHTTVPVDHGLGDSARALLDVAPSGTGRFTTASKSGRTDKDSPTNGKDPVGLNVPRIDWSGTFQDRTAEAKFRRFHWRHSFEVQIFAAFLVLAYNSYLLGFFAVLNNTPELLPVRLLPLIASVAWLCGAFYRLIVQSKRYGQAGRQGQQAQVSSLLDGGLAQAAKATDAAAESRHESFAEWLNQTNGYQWAIIIITAISALMIPVFIDCTTVNGTVACRQLRAGVFPAPPPMHAASLCLCQLVGSAQPWVNVAVVTIVWAELMVASFVFEQGTNSFYEALYIMASTFGFTLSLVVAAYWSPLVLRRLYAYSAAHAAATTAREARTQAIAREARTRERLAAAHTAKAISDITIGYVSHQLRNPLHAVAGILDNMVHRGDLPADVHEDSEEIRSALRHMARIVDDVQAHQQLVSGTIPLQVAAIDTRQLLSKLVSYYSKLYGASIRISIADSVPALVMLDPIRTVQIVSNALQNAIDASPAGMKPCIAVNMQTLRRMGDAGAQIDCLGKREMQKGKADDLESGEMSRTLQAQSHTVDMPAGQDSRDRGSVQPVETQIVVVPETTLAEVGVPASLPDKPRTKQLTLQISIDNWGKQLPDVPIELLFAPFDPYSVKRLPSPSLDERQVRAEQVSAEPVREPTAALPGAGTTPPTTGHSLGSEDRTVSTLHNSASTRDSMVSNSTMPSSSGTASTLRLRHTGLGLSIIRLVARLMGGRVGLYTVQEAIMPDDVAVEAVKAQVELTRLCLTRFFVEIPVDEAPPARSHPADDSRVRADGQRTLTEHRAGEDAAGQDTAEGAAPLAAGAVAYQEGAHGVAPSQAQLSFKAALLRASLGSSTPAVAASTDDTPLDHSHVSDKRMRPYNRRYASACSGLKGGLGLGLIPPSLHLPASPVPSPVLMQLAAANRTQKLHVLNELSSSSGSSTPGIRSPVNLKLRILVVDDEETNVRINRRFLEGLGCTVQVATDGDEVLQVVQAAERDGRPFDAILLDVVMRRVSGDVACSQLRAHGYTLPIIAATGNTAQGDVELYDAKGFTAVLAKPFSQKDVLLCLRSVGLARPAEPPEGA